MGKNYKEKLGIKYKRGSGIGIAKKGFVINMSETSITRSIRSFIKEGSGDTSESGSICNNTPLVRIAQALQGDWRDKITLVKPLAETGENE